MLYLILLGARVFREKQPATGARETDLTLLLTTHLNIDIEPKNAAAAASCRIYRGDSVCVAT